MVRGLPPVVAGMDAKQLSQLSQQLVTPVVAGRLTRSHGGAEHPFSRGGSPVVAGLRTGQSCRGVIQLCRPEDMIYPVADRKKMSPSSSPPSSSCRRRRLHVVVLAEFGIV